MLMASDWPFLAGSQWLFWRPRTVVKIKDEKPTLQEVINRFLLVKESQHTGEEAMKDYRNCLKRFLGESQNSVEYPSSGSAPKS